MYVCNFYGIFNHAYQKVCVCVCVKPKQVSVMRSCMAFFDDIKKLFTSIHKLFLLPLIIIIFLCCSSAHKHRTQFNSQHFIIQCKHKCLNMKKKKRREKKCWHVDDDDDDSCLNFILKGGKYFLFISCTNLYRTS